MERAAQHMLCQRDYVVQAAALRPHPQAQPFSFRKEKTFGEMGGVRVTKTLNECSVQIDTHYFLI